MIDNMVTLTRLNGIKIMINADLVEFMEETPDTVITLTTGKKFIVRESTRFIKEEIAKYQLMLHNNLKP